MTDVAIAGGGPVGLALAVTLARCGIAVTVFEQRWTPTPLEESRAITWMPGALEFLDWLEITERFAAIGMRRHVHEFWSRRRRLVSVRYDRLDHRHPYTLMLPQHHTERLLQEAAEASGLVEIRRGHRVRGADQVGRPPCSPSTVPTGSTQCQRRGPSARTGRGAPFAGHWEWRSGGGTTAATRQWRTST